MSATRWCRALSLALLASGCAGGFWPNQRPIPVPTVPREDDHSAPTPEAAAPEAGVAATPSGGAKRAATGDARGDLGGSGRDGLHPVELSPADCLLEVQSRDLAAAAVDETVPGVELAMRLTGELNDVAVVWDRDRSPGGAGELDILDCRLVLVLDDLTRLAAGLGVARIEHISLLRPGARIGGSGKPSQHALGLAIDVKAVVLFDGTRLVVEDDWGGSVGSSPCALPADAPERAQLLRGLFCAAADAGVFHTVLTPGYDRAHFNHVHMDVKAGRTSVYIR